MSWMFLLLAAACEMVWPLGFKYTKGFSTHHWATAVTFAIMGLSLYLMSLSTRHVPVGTAYAVWTGLGAAGTAVLGMVLFHESREWMRIACLTMIIAGAVGLKFLSPPAPADKAPEAAATPEDAQS
jgi:quaternary ammonium compound-resistance protein SugE